MITADRKRKEEDAGRDMDYILIISLMYLSGLVSHVCWDRKSDDDKLNWIVAGFFI